MAVLVAVTIAGGTGHYLALDIAVGVVSLALVPLLARWPVPAALVLSVLAAVSPVELMWGKLLGQLGVGLVILAIYIGLGILALVQYSLMGLLDPPQLRLRNALRGEFSRHRFQRPDDAESLNNFFGFRAPDLNASVARRLDQTLGRQDADRLPHRAARAQESAAQFHLDKARSRRQLSGDDEVAQHVRDRTAFLGTAGGVRNHDRRARRYVGNIFLTGNSPRLPERHGIQTGW